VKATSELEEPHRHQLRQRMDSPAACASCALPTWDESNHSPADTLHRHRSATFSLYFRALGPVTLWQFSQRMATYA